MKKSLIRNELNDDETLDDGIQPKKLFLGQCFGAALVMRGKNDPHISVQFLTEDDGHWFPTSSAFSSYWTSEAQDVINAAIAWMQSYAEKDPSGFGFVFPEPIQ